MEVYISQPVIPIFLLALTGRGNLCEKALSLCLVWRTPEWQQIPDFRAGRDLRDFTPKTHK